MDSQLSELQPAGNQTENCPTSPTFPNLGRFVQTRVSSFQTAATHVLVWLFTVSEPQVVEYSLKVSPLQHFSTVQ